MLCVLILILIILFKPKMFNNKIVKIILFIELCQKMLNIFFLVFKHLGTLNI